MENEHEVSQTDTTKVDEDKAAPELETVLQEFEAETEPEKAQEQLNDKARLDRLEQAERDRVKERTIEDVNKAAKDIKTELGVNLPDIFIRGALLAKAEEDPRFLSAWQKRTEDPSKFTKVMKAFAKELKDSFPDTSLTETRNDVISAVKSAATHKVSDGPSKADLAKMTDAEFAEHKRGLARG